MTHRERLLAALRHQEPDRIPIDLGGCGTTGIVLEAHRKLCHHLGIQLEAPPPFLARRFDTVVPDERLMVRLEVDARPLSLSAPDRQPEHTPSDNVLIDEWGVRWERRQGAHYIAVHGPLQDLSEPDQMSLKHLTVPDASDPGRYRRFRERAQALHEGTDYAVVFSAGPGPVHVGQWVRGYAEWLQDLHLNRSFVLGLAERATDFWTATTRRALEEAAEFIDVVMFGDDLGTQASSVLRPQMYRELILPFHRQMVETVRRFGKPVLHHSCGSIYALIPDLIEIGVDALNPVQVSARNMEPERLKREFGRDITFWGAIDTQRVLPQGGREEVRSEVRRRIDELGHGGGYVLSAVHNIQPDVPPQNIVTMFEEALAYSGTRSVAEVRDGQPRPSAQKST
jgi:uroporphyrinogen decarboxylase